MTTQQIINELKRLSAADLLRVIEAATQRMKEELGQVYLVNRAPTMQEQLAKAADALWQDYANDEELRAFTILDGEDFIHAEG